MSFLRYLLPRLFFILIFFITAFYNDFANPLLLLNLFFEVEVTVLQADMSRFPLFIVLSISLSLVLGLSLHFLIKRSRGKEEAL